MLRLPVASAMTSAGRKTLARGEANSLANRLGSPSGERAYNVPRSRAFARPSPRRPCSSPLRSVRARRRPEFAGP